MKAVKEGMQRGGKLAWLVLSTGAGCFYGLLGGMCIYRAYEDYLLNESLPELVKIYLFAVLFFFFFAITFPPMASYCRRRLETPKIHNEVRQEKGRLEYGRKSVTQKAVFMVIWLYVTLAGYFLLCEYGNGLPQTAWLLPGIALFCLLLCYVLCLFWEKGRAKAILGAGYGAAVLCVGEIGCLFDVLPAKNGAIILIGTLLTGPAAGLLLRMCYLPYLAWLGAPKQKKLTEIWRKRLSRGGSLICGIGLIWLFAASRYCGEIEPLQDAEGYYLLRSRAGFEWMIEAVDEDEKTDINVRLVEDIILNDTEGWENWNENPPEHKYYFMLYYNGNFDGNGYALIGYYSQKEMPIFGRLQEQAVVRDLTVRESFFYTTYDTWYYTNEDGTADIMDAASICITNEGQIENCVIDACVTGAGEAGGIVSGNYGSIRNCRFLGTVTAGTYWKEHEEVQEENWENTTWRTGGICRYNQGEIASCVNEGSVTNYGMEGIGCCEQSVAGGIAGRNAPDGSITYSENNGSVQALHWAGGIAGVNTGEIYHCGNNGTVLVETVDMGYVQYLASAGICPSNGGTIDSCYSTGEATVHQTVSSFLTPIYAIADSNINSKRGEIRNSYYLDKSTNQLYRQPGVYRLSAEEMEHIEDYLTGGLCMEDTDTLELLSDNSEIPGTGAADFTRLILEPEADGMNGAEMGEDGVTDEETAETDGTLVYEVQPGNSLWSIAEKFYGDGSYYPYLLTEAGGESTLIYPGDRVRVPNIVFYLLHASDDEGMEYVYNDPDDAVPLRYMFVKPRDWYMGSTDCDYGLSSLWPKYDENCLPTHDYDAGIDYVGARILYCFDANVAGDVFADWEAAKQSIRDSAAAYCGNSVQKLRFYRYRLDNGSCLYGYSFQLERKTETLNCVAFYRFSEGMRTEYIGIEPLAGNLDLLERVRYLAARVDQGDELVFLKENDTGEEFGGRENWEFLSLHNPFWIAKNYDLHEENGVYALWTGRQ